jgi:hypothetical protein
MQPTFKDRQKVNVTSKAGIKPGRVVATHPGARGAFVEVDHGEGKTQRYRPSKLTPA